MATPRSTQAHQKRVQQIANEAADKIAAEAPLEEEVVVVVEELPPGEVTPTRRMARAEQEGIGLAFEMLAQAQKFMMSGIGQWIDLATAPLIGTSPSTRDGTGSAFNMRHLVDESFRLAEGVLASQKEFTLEVMETVTRPRAA
jgi:hypothetical protein